MGSIFKPKVPEVKTPAPAIDEPVKEPVEPELGYQETEAQKRKKGKKGLKIDLKPNSSSASGKGLNIV